MVTLAQAKEHLRIPFSEDDAYIQSLIDVVEAIIEMRVEIVAESKVLDQARLLLIGHYYNNREITTDIAVNNIPNTADYLIDLYKYNVSLIFNVQ